MIKKITSLILIALLLALMSACNTMQGMGKDIKTLGEKIEDSSKK